MPIYIQYDGIKGVVTPATPAGDSLGSEYKYVSVRRPSSTQEAGDALPQQGLTADEGDGVAAINHGTTVLAWARTDGVSTLPIAEELAARGGENAGQIEIDGFSWGTAASAEAGSGVVKFGAGTLLLGNISGHSAGGVGEDLLIGGTTSHDAAYGGSFSGGVFVGAGSVGSGHSAGAARPMESLAINFTKIEYRNEPDHSFDLFAGAPDADSQPTEQFMLNFSTGDWAW